MFGTIAFLISITILMEGYMMLTGSFHITFGGFLGLLFGLIIVPVMTLKFYKTTSHAFVKRRLWYIFFIALLFAMAIESLHLLVHPIDAPPFEFLYDDITEKWLWAALIHGLALASSMLLLSSEKIWLYLSKQLQPEFDAEN